MLDRFNGSRWDLPVGALSGARMKGLLIAGPGPADGPPEGAVAGLPKPAWFTPASLRLLDSFLSSKLLVYCSTCGDLGWPQKQCLQGCLQGRRAKHDDW